MQTQLIQMKEEKDEVISLVNQFQLKISSLKENIDKLQNQIRKSKKINQNLTKQLNDSQ
jgi:hypothetical protein